MITDKCTERVVHVTNLDKINHCSLVLMVIGADLPMDEISAMLDMEPTSVVRKGDVINRLPRMVAGEDEWVYARELESPQGRDEIMKGILEKIRRSKEGLEKVKQFGEVRLRLRVQSDYAQMAYCLMPETLSDLAGIGLPLDISSISWGEIGM